MSAPVCDADLASFRAVRPRLFGIAYRVLGNRSDADDVVQDAWIRWQRADRDEVRDPAAFLATTVTRLAINVTQSAHGRRELAVADRPEDADPDADPSREAERRDALAVAIRVLLAKLSPTERAAYLLREAFDHPYARIARVLSLSEANARQLVARARRRLADGSRRSVESGEHRRLLTAFASAAESGELAPLERLLAADCAPARLAA